METLLLFSPEVQNSKATVTSVSAIELMLCSLHEQTPPHDLTRTVQGRPCQPPVPLKR